jgi:hypothetical protein
VSPSQAGRSETIASAIIARIKIVSDMVMTKVAVSSLRFESQQ